MVWLKSASWNLGCRLPGSKNRNTATIKNAFLEAFDYLGGVPTLAKWACANRTNFYTLAARLIPKQTHIASKFALNSADVAELDAAIAVLATQSCLGIIAGRKMRRRCTNRVANYPPYAKQHAFHAMGATMRERLLILANQSGKTAVCLS